MYKCYKKESDGSFVETQINEEVKKSFKYNAAKAYLQISATEQSSGFLINEDNYLQSFDFDDCRYIEGEGIIGSCVAKELQGKFINVDSEFDIENRELECYLGTEINEKISKNYSITEDEEIEIGKTYYIQNEDGSYSEVENPVVSDISNYYEMNIVVDKADYYLKLGTFIVQKPENNNAKDNTSFYALDYMIKFNKQYVHRMEKYFPTEDTEIIQDKKYYILTEGGEYEEVIVPQKEELSTYYEIIDEYTLLELLQDICNQSEVKLGTTNFRNANYVVKGNRFDSGVTCRDVLKAISQAAFSWARINEDNELVLDFDLSNEITEEIDYNEYYSLMINDNYGPINTIVMRNSQIEGENITIKDETAIEINGTKELVISDNPFAYSEETRREIIEAGKALYGFTYLPLSVETIGAAYLNCKDKIKVKNMQDKDLETYIFDTVIHYNGTIKSDINTLAMTDVETKYKYDGSLTTAQRRTELKVDKAEQKITSLIEKTTEQGSKLTNVEQDLDGVKTTIKDTTGEFQDKLAVIEETISGISTQLITTGGQNLIRNSVGYFGNEYWDLEDTEEQSLIKGNNSTDVKQNSISGSALEIQNETVYQTINEIKNGDYFISFSYKKLIDTAIARLDVNNQRYILSESNWTEHGDIISVTENQIKISITSDLASSVLITDLILSEGTTKAGWSQNANESYTDNVQIGKGIRITSTGAKTEFVAEADGIKINYIDEETKQVIKKVAEFTEYGTETEGLIAHKDVKIADSLLIQKIGNQTWFSSL